MNGKKEKKKWGVLIFMVFIMIGTSFTFVFYGFSVTDAVKYNGYKFTFEPSQSIWTAEISGREAAFTFLPKDLEAIPADDFSGKLKEKFEIDVTYDINSTYAQSIALAQHQMALTLSNFDVYVRKGFTSNNSYNLPIITCGNATQHVPVVYFRHGNLTEIFSSGYCIIAQAPSNADFIMAKDRLLYGMLGVMK